jgi:hypothetical protein
MNINIVSIFMQKTGTKTYYWGQDTENQIFLLNKYSKLKQILKLLPNFKPDNHNIFQTLNFDKDDYFNIPRSKITRITHADYSLSF